MATVALCAACSHALAQHDDDVILMMEGFQIVTGVMHDGTFEPSQLWVIDINDGITDDPGYDAPSGALEPNSSTGISIRAALRAWDYDNVHFLNIAEETMVITRLGFSIETPAQDPRSLGQFPVLPLGATSSVGSLHVHPWYELTAPASDGMYLLELEFWINPGLLPVFIVSNPFWVIFTKNENDEDMIHQAEEWVFDNLIDPVEPPKCPADLTGSGSVGVQDLLVLLSEWGPCDAPEDCPADLTGNGIVGVQDLLVLLSEWGPCP